MCVGSVREGVGGRSPGGRSAPFSVCARAENAKSALCDPFGFCAAKASNHSTTHDTGGGDNDFAESRHCDSSGEDKTLGDDMSQLYDSDDDCRES